MEKDVLVKNKKFKRFDIINNLINRFNYKSYLEIGTANRKWCFNKIEIDNKICVDPDENANADFVGISDDFFKQNKKTFDIIFIDGMHEYKQVLCDIKNSLNVLNKGGAIVLHDCNPKSMKAAIPYSELNLNNTRNINSIWNGDVYKAFIDFKYNEFRDVYKNDSVLFTIDTDFGCGVFVNREALEINNLFDNNLKSFDDITFKFFKQNRNELLNLISVEKFKNLYFKN